MHDAVQRRHAAAPCGGAMWRHARCSQAAARRRVCAATLPAAPRPPRTQRVGDHRGARDADAAGAQLLRQRVHGGFAARRTVALAAVRPAAGGAGARSGASVAFRAMACHDCAGACGGGRLLLLLVPQLQITIWGALAHMTTFPAPGADHWQCLNAKQGIANTKLAACASPHPLQTPANAFATARPDRDARQPWRAASSAEVPSAPPWPSTWRARGTRRCCGRARRRCVWGVLHQRPPARASGIAPQAAVR